MRRLRHKLSAAALTFALGLAAYTAWPEFSPRPATEGAVAASPEREEQWHRLYEASRMSEDERLSREVQDMLRCANRAGVSDARPVRGGGRTRCQRADGSEHEPSAAAGEYGPFFVRVKRGHEAWERRNTEFVESFRSSAEATEDALRHKGALLAP